MQSFNHTGLQNYKLKEYINYPQKGGCSEIQIITFYMGEGAHSAPHFKIVYRTIFFYFYFRPPMNYGYNKGSCSCGAL